MTNAKNIVVSNKEDNIKSIKSINFNNVTPIIEEQKLDTEIKRDPRFTNELVDQIRQSESEISIYKSTNSENTKLVNELKIDQYVGLIAHIAPLKLSASGNLTKADTRAISEDLVNECNMSKANAKLLKDNSVKFVVKFDVPSQATPEMIRDIMTDNGITSQTKLKQAVNPQDDILLGDKIARMIYGKMKTVKNTEGVAEDKFVQTDLSADDIKIIEETLADAKRMWEAVEKANKESAKDQSEDNQQVKDTFQALGI